MASHKELRAKLAIERASAELHLGYVEDALFLREFDRAILSLETVKGHLIAAQSLAKELEKPEERV